jgi:hypothetical protein
MLKKEETHYDATKFGGSKWNTETSSQATSWLLFLTSRSAFCSVYVW